MVTRWYDQWVLGTLGCACLMALPAQASERVNMMPGVADQEVAEADSFAWRGRTFLIDGNASDTTVSLFAGDFVSPLDGEMVIVRTNAPATNDTPIAVGMVRIAVRKAVFLATQWDPANNFLPEPAVLFLDTRFPSTGVYNPRTGGVRLRLYLRGHCGVAPTPMPLYLYGTVRDGHLRLVGDNGPVSDAWMSVSISASSVSHRAEIRYSTERGFPVPDPTGTTPGWISDGDLLGEHTCLILSNHELTSRLGVMPIVPDLGLDAVTWTTYRPVLFSLEDSVWSETLGQLGHGDLLSITGHIVRTNAELIQHFGPFTGIAADVGLDAVHLPTGPLVNATSADCCDPWILFSVETRFFSGGLNRWIGHGDLLSNCGRVYRTNRQLLAAFDPIAVPCLTAEECAALAEADDVADEPALADLLPCTSDDNALCVDLGLDGVFVHDRGEIWFSTEIGFWDANLGWVSAGDVLSTRGHIVRPIERLVDVCEPLVDYWDFGLDALDWLAPTANAFAVPAEAVPSEAVSPENVR